jgi:hypothetical protein
MTTHRHEPLAVASSGVTTPLFFDRQVIQAEDLTLGEDARSAELARLRTYLMGSGVVAGLVPRLEQHQIEDPRYELGYLVISPGYGILPSGAELYLPDPLRIPAPLAALRSHCGGDVQGCELPGSPGHDRDRPEGRDDDEDNGPREAGTAPSALLVARRRQHPARLRPGVPEGCRHPASDQRPTRMCTSVEIDLVCLGPDSTVPSVAPCDELAEVVCGHRTDVQVEMPEPVAEEDDYLVLGRVREVDGELELDQTGRSRLLPYRLIHDWLVACICPLQSPDRKPAPDPDPDPDPR